MGLNLHHSRQYEDGLHLVQIPQAESEEIYGDGVHANICNRLEQYLNKCSREAIEYGAAMKGDRYPFTGKDKRYWESQYRESCREHKRYTDRLRACKDIEWSIW